MNPLDPNTQNNSSVPTSPVPNGQGTVSGVSPSAVQPGAVFHPPSATDQITAAQSAAPGIDSIGSVPPASNPINQTPVTSGVDSPNAPQSSSTQPEVAASYAGAAAPDAAGTALGNNSPLHPEVLAKDLWGGGTPPPEEPAPKAKNPWFKSLWFLILLALLGAGAIAGAFLIFSKPSGDTTVNNSTVNEDYVVTSVPLSDLAADQIISISNDSQLAINGQLRINNSAVIQASEQPTNPEAGMLWYSSANNTLYYYNGNQFVPMSTTIGGVGGTIAVGSGLSLAGNTIQNTGVTSVQGQSGAVNFNAGGGISISGTTISVSGVQQGGVLVGSGGGIGTVLPASPGLCLISNASNLPEFGSCTGTTTVTALNGFSGSVNILPGSGITVTPGGNTLTIATTGGTGVTALNGGSGGLSIANASLSGSTITINNASSSGLGLVQGDGSTVVINGSGVISIGQNVATSANVTFNQLTLATDLSVANGGTGASSFSAGGLLVGNGGSPLSVVTAGSSGQCLLSNSPGTAPSFTSCPVGGNISQGSFQTTDFLVKYDSTTNTITNSILQDNGTTATVTGNLTVNSGIITGSGSGVTNVNAALLQGFAASAFQPAFVTLGVTSGGTGASTLTANGLLLGNGTSPVTAIAPASAGQCLLSTGTGSAPSFQNCPVGGNVTALSGTAGYLTKFATGGVDIENSDLLVQSGGLQVTAASYYLDIFNGSTSTFTIQNNNGGNVANLVVEGSTTSSGGLFVGAGKGITSGTGINISAGTSANDNITFETRDSLGNLLSFIFPSSGGTGQTICTSGITCASGGGQAVILEPGTGSGTAQATAANRPSIWINRTAGTAEILKLQAAGNDALVVAYDGKVNIGSSSLTGNLIFRNANNSNAITLTSNAPSSSYTLTLPDDDGSNLDCLKSNGSGVLSWGTCVAGGSGGGITGSGTVGTISLFTPNGQTLGDSIITQPASNLIDVEGNLRLGTVSSLTGQLVLANAGTGFTTSLQSGSGNLADLTFTLPSADGSANQCLKTDGAGVLGFTTCLSGGGAGGGVTELNNISGDVDILGTANQITVTPSGQNITLSLPQSIATSSAPTFGGVSLTGAGQLTLGNGSGQSGTITVRDGSTANYALIQAAGAFGANRNINIPDADGTLAVSASGNIALSAAGNITFTGVLPVTSGGTGSGNASGARTNLGAAASGANSDITSLTAVTTLQNSSGSLTVGNTSETLTLQGGAATKLTATSGGFTNELVFAAPSGSSKTITVPNETGVICLQGSGSCGFLTAAVTSLQGQTGSLSLVAGTGIGITGLNISNNGVTSLAGTANKISVSGATGAVTLSLPNDVNIGTPGSAAGTLSVYGASGTYRAILQPATLTSDRTITIPDAPGTLAVSASGNIALSAAGDISFTGTLPVANGGTGVTTTPTNGQLLIGNGSGYTVASLSAGAGIVITPGSGSIQIAAPAAGACASCANQALNNLLGTSIGTDTVARLNSSGTALVASDITDNGTNVVVGNASDNNQTVTIQGGVGASAVSIQSLAAGTINIATANVANTVQIGNTTNGVSQTIGIGNNNISGSVNQVTIGSTQGASSTTLQGGTAGIVATSTAATTNAFTVNANSLTTGTGFRVTTTNSAQTTANLFVASQTNSFTTATTVSGNTANISRSISGNVPIAGALALNSTAGTVVAGGSSIAHTVNAGSDRIMVVAAYSGVPSTWTVGATVQNFVRYGSTPFYYITAPTVGSGTVAFSSACGYNCTVSTWNNADQTTPFVGYESNSCATFGCTTTSNAIATTTYDKLLSIGYSYGSAGVSGAGGGQVLMGSVNSILNGIFYENVSVHYKNGAAGSTSASYTAGLSSAAVYATVLKQSLGAASPITGSVASISNNCTVVTSTCADTSNVLNLNQQFTGATGAVLGIQNSSSAADIQLSAVGIIQSQDKTTASTNSTGVTFKTGNATGATSNSGSVTIDVGTATGTTGTVRVGNTNASNVYVGNSSGANTVTIQSGTAGIAASSTTASGVGLNLTTNNLQAGTGLAVSQTASTATLGDWISGNLLSATRNITSNSPATVKLDSTSDGGNGAGGSGSPTTWSHTIAPQSNRALVVSAGTMQSDASNPGCSATYNGVAMSAVATTSVASLVPGLTNYRLYNYIWYLANPDVGTANVVVSCTAASAARNQYATSWYNVSTYAQPSPTTLQQANSGAQSWNPSQTVNGTTVNDVAIDSLVTSASSPTAGTGGAPQTILDTPPGSDGMRSSWKQATATSTNMQWSFSSTWYTYATIVLKASASGSSGITGALGSLRSNCSLSGVGVCNDSSNILDLNQQNAGATGAVLKIQNAGTGADIQLGKGTIQTAATNATSSNTNGVSIQSGNATGATSNSGNVTIDSGTATGTAGNIYIGNANAMTVQIGNSSSKLGAWTNSAGYNLPANRVNHGATVYNGYAYVVGGQSSTNINTATNTVYYAKLKADGTIPTAGSGVWTATTAISVSGTKNRTNAQAVAVNGYLYVIGGFDETTTAQSTVYYAKINSDGTVGTWAASPYSLPAIRAYHKSFTANGYLYAVGGTTTNAAATASNTVYYARVNADGTTGTWNTTQPIGGGSPVNRYAGAVTYANGYVYYSGGNDAAGTTQSTVYYAKINTDGTIPSSGNGVWATTSAVVVNAVSQPRYNHTMVASNGYLYLFGGSTATSQSGVYSAPFNADGTIGTWTSQTSLTTAVSGHSTFVANGYFYHIGGADYFSATTYNTVYIASTPRVVIASNLDLINTDNSGLTEGGGGGQLTAGNTRIVGTIEVSDQANFVQGVSIGGNLTVGGKASNANPVFAVQNSSGQNLLAADTVNTRVTVSGDLLASNVAVPAVTTTTTGVGGSNLSTIALTAASTFANGDVIFVDNPSGQDYFTRILSGGGGTTLTISPAVSYGTAAGYSGAATITKYTTQNIGAIQTNAATPALGDRFFQGYFLGGVVTGAGSTTLSDGNLQGTGMMNYTATSHTFNTNSLISGSANLAAFTQSGTATNGASQSGNILNASRNITAPAATVTKTGSTGTFAGLTNNGNGQATITHTVAAGITNGAVVVTIAGPGSGGFGIMPASAVSWNGQPMTLYAAADNSLNAYSMVWILVNPTPATNGTITITNAFGFGQTDVVASVSNYSNVDPSSPVRAANGYPCLVSCGTASLSLSSSANDMVIDSLATLNTSTNTPGASQTTLVNSPSPNQKGTASYKAGAAGSQAVSQTVSGTSFAYSAVSLRPTSVIYTGATASISSNCSGDNCVDSSNILKVNQQFGGATGSAANIQNAGTGATLQIQNTNDSGQGLSVSNMSGSSILSTDTGSLVPNPSFELNSNGSTPTNWSVTGSGNTFTQSGSAAKYGSSSGVFTGAGTAGTVTGTLTQTLAPNTTYTLSGWFISSSFLFTSTTPTVGGTACGAAWNIYSPGAWTQFTCTVTTGGSPTNTITFPTPASTYSAVYMDGVRVNQGSTVSTGNIQLNGVVNSSVLMRNATNSSTAFQIQNTAGINGVQVSTNNLSLTGINVADATLKVAMDSVSGRSISAAGIVSGSAFNSANGDYAEWIPWSGPKPPAGDVIDYNGAKMVVSSLETAAVIANDKFPGGNSILVAFTGQLGVRVTGAVAAGDYLVDNGDGSARAVSPSTATLADYVSRVGTALESNGINGKVLTLIAGPGVNNSQFSQQSNSFADLNVSGTFTTNELVVMGNAFFQGNITVNGRIITGGGVPTTSALSASGTGATMVIEGNDTAGKITITTGSDPAAGEIGRVNFSSAFGNDARTNLTPMNGSAAELQYYYSSTNNNFTLKSNNQLAPNTTYIYSYWVVE